MIHDRIENMHLYLNEDLILKLNNAMEGIRQNQNEGNYALRNDDLYFKFLNYKTRGSNWTIESHKKYVDIQFVLSGIEIIRVYDTDNLFIMEEYNSETDNIFYNTKHDLPVSELRLIPGYFCVFFPDDIHQTQIADSNGSQHITKLVFKVHEKFFA